MGFRSQRVGRYEGIVEEGEKVKVGQDGLTVKPSGEVLGGAALVSDLHDVEVLLHSSVNTVHYKPIQPIQHRCPSVMDREYIFLSSDEILSQHHPTKHD